MKSVVKNMRQKLANGMMDPGEMYAGLARLNPPGDRITGYASGRNRCRL